MPYVRVRSMRRRAGTLFPVMSPEPAVKPEPQLEPTHRCDVWIPDVWRMHAHGEPWQCPRCGAVWRVVIESNQTKEG